MTTFTEQMLHHAIKSFDDDLLSKGFTPRNYQSEPEFPASMVQGMLRDATAQARQQVITKFEESQLRSQKTFTFLAIVTSALLLTCLCFVAN